MKSLVQSFALSLVLLFLPLQTFAADMTREVIVGTTATLITFTSGYTGRLVENRGPNSLWCGFGSSTAAVAFKSHEIVSGGYWAFDQPQGITPLYCLTAVLQVTLAATVISEVR